MRDSETVKADEIKKDDPSFVFKLPTEADFTSPVNKKTKPHKKKRKEEKKRNYKIPKAILPFLIFLTFLFSFSLLALIGYRSLGAYDQMMKLSEKINDKSATLRTALKEQDLEKSMVHLAELKFDVEQARYIAQSWGQDIQLFRYIGLSKVSGLTEKEELLDLAGSAFSVSAKMEESLIDFKTKGVFGKKTDSYLLDLKLIRKELLDSLPDIRNQASLLKKKAELSNTDIAKVIIPTINDSLVMIETATKIADNDLLWLSAKGEPKKLLIIFQNNSELRGGSGGSFGSFGVANIENGRLSKIDFGTNIYKLDNAFKEKKAVDPPSELDAFGSWTLKQSGFAIDGKEALDKIRWFYKEETGESVDGIITIDTTAFTSVLKILGPIELKRYGGKIIDYENFKIEIEREVQQDYFNRVGGKEENEPKKIIGELMPVFLDKLVVALGKEDKSLQIAGSLAESIRNKDILFNFNNADFQQRLDGLNITGRVKPFLGDYLYVNNSNLAGAKSSLNTKETLGLKTEIKADGEIFNSLSITRTHTGKDEFPDGLDRNYIRVLIPEDSKLLKFDPLEGNFQRYFDRGYRDGQPSWVDKEANKTTINFWMSTKPGETTKALMDYQSRYKISMGDEFTYQIMFQKQPGSPTDEISYEINYPVGYFPVNVLNYDMINKKIYLTFDLEEDKIVKLKFRKGKVAD